MAALPRITPAQRRSMLGVRQRLVPEHRSADPVEVAQAVVGLHATDPATVHLSLAARMVRPDPAAVHDALYESRTLTRMLCMRRTMFVLPTWLAPVVDAASARAVAAQERKRHVQQIREALGHDEEWYAAAQQAALAELARRGEATTAELGDAVPELQEKLTNSPGKPYESTQRVASRMLGVLAAEGRIRRGLPLGGWSANQYRWHVAEPHPELPVEQARSELATHYLGQYGPATLDDLKWWTGWTKTNTRKALAAAADVREVELAEGPGYALAADAEAAASGTLGREQAGWVALLPALDSTAMGWRHRDWYLEPSYVSALFDSNGNIGPTVWADGRIIGGWSQRADTGEIVWRLLSDPGAERRAQVASEADRLTEFLDGARFKPSFPTPLERELRGGR